MIITKALAVFVNDLLLHYQVSKFPLVSRIAKPYLQLGIDLNYHKMLCHPVDNLRKREPMSNMSISKAPTLASEKENPRSHMPMVIVMMCGSFLTALNQSLMNTALPRFMEVFHITASQSQWVITLYALASGIVIPITAYLVRRFGTRAIYFAAMGLFIAGTLLGAIANTFEILLLGRVVQACGAGINMTLMQTVLFAVFPLNQRGTAMGYYTLAISLAPAFGPALSGWIIDTFFWRLLFAVQIPIAGVLLLIAVFMVRNVTGGGHPSFDMASVVLSTLAFGGLLFGFGTIGDVGFFSFTVITSLVVGVFFLIWFVRRQLALASPVLDMRILTHPSFAIPLSFAVVVWALFVGASAMLPMFMQRVLGFPAAYSGFAMVAGGLTMGMLSPVVGRAFDHRGARKLVACGMGLLFAACVAFVFMGSNTSVIYVALAFVVFMAGEAMAGSPLVTLSLSVLPTKKVAYGSAMYNTFRQVMAAIATAVLFSVMSGMSSIGASSGKADTSGAHAAFLVMAIIAGLMLVITLTLLSVSQGKGYRENWEGESKGSKE